MTDATWCETCEGSRRCLDCNGTGDDCLWCEQTGECPDCDKGLVVKSRNHCETCGTDEHAALVNYDMTWGDGDVVCKQCNNKIRDWDRD